jgi:hypothetical protein
MQIAAALIGLFSRLRARAQGMGSAIFTANQSAFQGQGALTRSFASLKGAVTQVATALVELVSRVQARVHSKLLAAFLTIAYFL